ncbi:2Fe-2S iron-sulfur cluster protein [Acinetobacter calcoaceticus]|uniref:2Fe-2S iron-sulfur cluster protein n=1 Tax=Acinetobacter calcoaceticus TaxID=471 RepID=A0A4R1XKK7_ACICA|nr:2Fe-2S iron-sulfur cluster protein [Acinetobacter calcoaceticus]
MIELMINAQLIRVIEGTTVAAALTLAQQCNSRLSVTGQVREPFCGMGVCQECRVSIDGKRVLSCQTLCRQGMKVESIA